MCEKKRLCEHVIIPGGIGQLAFQQNRCLQQAMGSETETKMLSGYISLGDRLIKKRNTKLYQYHMIDSYHSYVHNHTYHSYRSYDSYHSYCTSYLKGFSGLHSEGVRACRRLCCET